jgi:hypothetical protein
MVDEQSLQRLLTHQFILTQPVTLVLQPRQRVRTPSGGWQWQNTVPRAPQVMRLCEPSTVDQIMPSAPTAAQDGQVRKVVFMLLGEWDSTIGRDDVFTLDGAQYEVAEVAVFNGWEQRASVVRYG